MKFLDLPIDGDILYGRGEIEQWPDHEFTEALEHLFTFDQIEAVRWTQYTPYFNDGDPCIFGVYEPRFRIAGVTPTWPTLEDFVASYDDEFQRVAGSIVRWEGSYPERYPILDYDEVETQEFAMALREVLKHIDTHHRSLLLKLFGDHAEVTVLRDKIEVEFVTHE